MGDARATALEPQRPMGSGDGGAVASGCSVCDGGGDEVGDKIGAGDTRDSDDPAGSVDEGADAGRSDREKGVKERKRRRRKRPVQSSSEPTPPQVYKFVQPKRDGASPKLLPRVVAKGTRRPVDPRRWRAKMVQEQLDDLNTTDAQDQTVGKGAGILSGVDMSTALRVETAAVAETQPVEAGLAVELAEALQDLVIVSADGGCHWPVDKGGRILLTSWPSGERWWQGYPDGALVSSPEEAGDIPREVVVRVSEKAQSEAEVTVEAAKGVSKVHHTSAMAAAQTSSDVAQPAVKGSENTGLTAKDRSSARAFLEAEAAMAKMSSHTYDEQLALGLQRIHAHRYREAIVNFKRCHALEPNDPAACYNLACCYSLLRLSGLALRWLTSAVNLGLTDGGVLLEDTDLDNVRDAPRFRRLQERLHRDATIVRSAVSQGGDNGLDRASLERVKFFDEGAESEEEMDLAAEVVDAHLLGFPPPSTSRIESKPDDSDADGSAEDSDSSTEVSAQTESDDEAEVGKREISHKRQQRQKPTKGQAESLQRKMEGETARLRSTKCRRSKPKSPGVEQTLQPENHESKYHGVTWNIGTKLWQCQIPFEGQLKYIGQFDEETEAAQAYDDAAHETFGADVHCNANSILLNFPVPCTDCCTWGHACLAAGEPQEAADWFEQALQEGSQPSDEDRPMVAYQLAGCYATCLDSSLAIRWLSDAIQWGLGKISAADRLEPHTEAVFASLWRDARFLTLCAKLDEARNGPARQEHCRLVRRHRVARASACVKTAMLGTSTSSDSGDADNAGDDQVEQSPSPASFSNVAREDPEVRGEEVILNKKEHELDLFFEFWNENLSAMNDLFGRLATRLIPSDLIRTTLSRVIGGLKLETVDIEQCILDMLGLGIDGRVECGMPGTPSLFHTDIERVSRLAPSPAAPGIKSGRVKMSASARHRSLKTETLCRAATQDQLPQGGAATVPIVARVVDREEFLDRCAAVAVAWSRAVSRDARNEWLLEFEAGLGHVTTRSIVDLDHLGDTTSLRPPQPASKSTVEGTIGRGLSVPRSVPALLHSPGGLSATDVNVPRDQRPQEKSAPASAPVGVVDQPELHSDIAVAPGSGFVYDQPVLNLPSSGLVPRWREASDGLPENVRRDWTVETVAIWLRALGLSDSVVSRAHEAQIDGARLLADVEDPDLTECTILETLGLATLGSRKLLNRAIKSLRRKAELLDDYAASPVRPPDVDTFASLDTIAYVAEDAYFQRLEWTVATGQRDKQAPQDSASLSKPFSFGDVSSITTGL